MIKKILSGMLLLATIMTLGVVGLVAWMLWEVGNDFADGEYEGMEDLW